MKAPTPDAIAEGYERGLVAQHGEEGARYLCERVGITMPPDRAPDCESTLLYLKACRLMAAEPGLTLLDAVVRIEKERS